MGKNLILEQLTRYRPARCYQPVLADGDLETLLAALMSDPAFAERFQFYWTNGVPEPFPAVTRSLGPITVDEQAARIAAILLAARERERAATDPGYPPIP